MAQNLNLVLRITGDASGLKAEVVGAKREVEGLGKAGGAAGAEAGRGMDTMAAGIARVAAAAGGLAAVSGAIMAIARAGDTARQSLAQIETATGSLTRAREIYDALYRSSLQTGVSIADSAAAFSRFSIAAREIGGTNDQVLALVTGLQRAAIASNASAQEVSSATLQLGQALASGVLQGDELRSVLEAMPALAEALAKQLGVSIGELRRMGSEGQLTADRVFPALIRASEEVGKRLADAPLSIGRAMGQLGVATQGFLDQLDQAAGLSQRIARGLSGAATALEGIRRGAGLLTDAEQTGRMQARASELQARIAAAEAAAAGQASMSSQPRRGSIRGGLVGTARDQAGATAAGDLEAMRAEYFQLMQDIDRIERGAGEARGREEAEAARRAAEARRTRSQAELRELTEGLDKRLRIQREFADREAVIARGQESGAISPESALALRAQSQARLQEELRKAAEEGRGSGGSPRPGAQPRDPFADMQRQAERLTDSLRTPLETYNEAVTEATRLNDLFVSSQGRVGISSETLTRALTRAREEYDRTRERTEDEQALQRQGRALEELGRLGETAFDRVGQSITTAAAQGKIALNSLNNAGQAVVSELMQAFLKLALLNPLKNLATGGNSTTITDVLGAIGSRLLGGGAGSAPSGGTVGVGLGPITMETLPALGNHDGGIAGLEASFTRSVPSRLFRTAPRMHAGGFVGPDEQATILRRGEGVFTEEQMASLGPSGGSYTFAPTVNFSGNAGSADDRDGLLTTMRAMWLQDLRAAVPGIVDAAKGSLRSDVRRQGVDRALGAA